MAVGGEVTFLLVQAELASFHQSHGRKSLPWLWLHYASRLNSGVRPHMKILASLLVAIAIAALGAWEAFWRFDHFPSGDVAAPATGNYIAQIHTLPEGSVRPYSQEIARAHV